MSLQLDFHEALQKQERKERRENVYTLFSLFTLTSFTCLALAYLTIFMISMTYPEWRMSWPHFTYFAGLHALTLISLTLMEKNK